MLNNNTDIENMKNKSNDKKWHYSLQIGNKNTSKKQ